MSVGVDSSSGEESEKPERAEEPPIAEPAPERATEPVKIEPDPTYEELHALADRQEAEMASEDEAGLRGDDSFDELSNDAPGNGDAQTVDEPGVEDPDPTFEELQALAEQQEAEMAAEEEADKAASYPDGLQESGWEPETVIGFVQRWEDHEARWPQEEAAAVDHSGDEPGWWRGEGGQYLIVEENIVTGHHYDRLAAIRPEVTGSIEAIKAEVPGADLVGLEYQLKGIDRYKEKVAADLASTPERAVEKVTPNIPDALRYTYQFDKDDYVNGYDAVCERLRGQGFEMELSRNSWGDSQYKGINTRWRNEDGQMFEVQFHTPESFEAKQLTHKAYERLRNPLTDGQEMKELRVFQREVAACIPVPEQVNDIHNYRKKSG
ncbi:hypothetical protein [Nonomuraea sp. NPDC046570]|uniref:hypothetical protein n=1 Tax=Nonomuraea sp. NPDC046570 TaxID=3155255 RepID=UPI0033E32C80